MTEQIDFLKSQVTTKDSQLEKQAFHIQSLIQENSKLNIKLLPENAEKTAEPVVKTNSSAKAI
jgi:hypothetical protein